VDPESAGVFFVGTSALLLLATVARLGANTSLVYFVAQSRARGDASATAHLIRIATRPLALSVLLTSVVWVLITPWLTSEAASSSATQMVRLLALALPAAVLHEVWLSVTRGFRRMAPTVFVARIGLPALQLAAVCFVALLEGGASALTVAWAAPFIPAALIAWLLAHRTAVRAAAADSGPPVAAVTSASFWRFALPRAVSSVAQVGMARFDILLVAGIAGAAEAAVYVAATRFVVVGQLASLSLSQSVQPQIAESAAASDTAAIRRLYRVTTCWLILLTWPLYLSCAVLAPELLVLFGSDYGGAVPVVLIMSGAMLAATASGMVDVFLNMVGRSSATMINALVAVVSMVVLDLALIGPYGANGAAAGWGIAILIRNGLAITVLYRGQRIQPFSAASLLGMLVSAGTLGLIPLAVTLTAGSGLTWRLGALLLGLLTWVAAVTCLRDRLAVHELISQLHRRNRRVPTADRKEGSGL
jgi:O-antigen/teichoic acid export membrane protein